MMKFEIQKPKAQVCVTQSGTLPYRRFAICGTFANPGRLESSERLPSITRRYSRLKICATARRPIHRSLPGDFV